MIPFVDLKAQYQSIKSEIDTAIAEVIQDTAFISGKFAKHFEESFSKYSQNEHVIACANGTDSLEILMQSMGIGEGDEVIVPALTWISTSETVTSIGATPVFVDVDEYVTMDVAQIESKITQQTKLIIPVHLYGQPANMPAIMEIASRHGIKVLEDSAQAHGAEIVGQRVATFGDCGSFSFYPGKNLGAYGDAGAMVTNNAELARVARMICNHGQEGKHNHIMEGRNSRLDGIQGAILNVKLKYLEEWTEGRIANSKLYNQALEGLPIETPKVRDGARHVFHLYVIQCDRRNELMEHLKTDGIASVIHYPQPLPHVPCYRKLGHSMGDFPMSERTCDRILSLPMYPELPAEHIKQVADSIKAFYGG